MMSNIANCTSDNLKSMAFFLLVSVMIVVPGISAQVSNVGIANTQASSTDSPAAVFDAVSIKPNKSGPGTIRIETHADSYSATNIPLKMFLESAFGIKEDQILGLPSWAESAHFDINAKVVDPNIEELKKLNKQQKQLMLRSIMIERFQLKTHTEIRELPVYEMVIDKGGAKFKESVVDDTPDANKDPTTVKRGGLRVRNHEITAVAVPLSSLADELPEQVHRPVLDRTGLKGVYDLHMKWTPDSDSVDESSSEAPSIFTALQEQLGLKLQSAKGPVTVLVVDHIELLSEN